MGAPRKKKPLAPAFADQRADSGVGGPPSGQRRGGAGARPLGELQAAAETAEGKGGLVCPRCHAQQFKGGKNVLNTIPQEDSILRKRLCRICGFELLTVERRLGADN